MPRLLSRIASWSLPLFALLGIALAARSTEPATSPDPLPTFGEILGVNNDSLTTYKASGTSTPANDVRPTAIQRGVSMDGAQRAGAAWGMALGGSPFGSSWRGTSSLNGVDLRTGSFTPNERDISLPTEGVQVAVGRSYNGQQSDGSSRRDSAGVQGNNWAQTGFPEVLLWEHASDDAEDLVYLNFGADRFVEFKRTGASDTEFQGKQGTGGCAPHENSYHSAFVAQPPNRLSPTPAFAEGDAHVSFLETAQEACPRPSMLHPSCSRTGAPRGR